MDVSPDFAAELKQRAEQLRASGALGRAGVLSRLFDYLLERSFANVAPKEIEIALNVFGKAPDFDSSSDAIVRVYVHKLRRRLDEYYARSSSLGRIVIPRGEYRLVLERAEPVRADDVASFLHQAIAAAVSPSWKRWIASAAALLGAAILGAAIGAVPSVCHGTELPADSGVSAYSVGSTVRT